MCKSRDEPEEVVVGAVLLNRFRVLERIGSGGFGTVYRAWDGRLERDVAVKVIDASGAASKRVLREAQAAARLNHPGIVTLYEFGTDGRTAFLVSEFVQGATLHELSRQGELSDRDVAEVGVDLCEALDHAHARGVVHRDIKPQNVLLGELEPEAKLMDFGIARVLGEAGLTASGDVVGTLAYMAPEQAEGREAGPEADVYSLALMLYECWSGRNPNARGTPAATARAIGRAVPPLRRERRDLPPALTGTIDSCLRADPQARPGLEQLGEALDGSLAELADTAPARTRRGEARAAAQTLTAMLPAAAVGGLTAAAMIATGRTGPLWPYALPLVAAAAALLRPRLGYLLAGGGLALWLASSGRPGAALMLALVLLPPALLVGGEGGMLVLPAAAPLLGSLGLAPLYPALAGLGGSVRDRLALGAAGYAWLALAEGVLGRSLLFGAPAGPPDGWSASLSGAVGDFLVPTVTSGRFLAGVACFALAAALIGYLARDLSGTARDLRGALRSDRRQATLS